MNNVAHAIAPTAPMQTMAALNRPKMTARDSFS